MATAKPTTTRTLLIECSDHRKRKLTIPATAKVTYGALQPGRMQGHDGSNFLRVYEGTKQTLCMGGVRSFMDLSYGLEVEKIVTRTKDYDEVRDGHTVTKQRKIKVKAGFFLPAEMRFKTCAMM